LAGQALIRIGLTGVYFWFDLYVGYVVVVVGVVCLLEDKLEQVFGCWWELVELLELLLHVVKE